jgi:hypothetical protein
VGSGKGWYKSVPFSQVDVSLVGQGVKPHDQLCLTLHFRHPNSDNEPEGWLRWEFGRERWARLVYFTFGDSVDSIQASFEKKPWLPKFVEALATYKGWLSEIDRTSCDESRPGSVASPLPIFGAFKHEILSGCTLGAEPYGFIRLSPQNWFEIVAASIDLWDEDM